MRLFDLPARRGRQTARCMYCVLQRRYAGVTAPTTSRCFDWVATVGQPGPAAGGIGMRSRPASRFRYS